MTNPTDSDREIYDLCDFCEGSGERDWLEGAPCPYCNGQGIVLISAEIDGDEYLYEDDEP
mgnify:CR=1 FL=1